MGFDKKDLSVCLKKYLIITIANVFGVNTGEIKKKVNFSAYYVTEREKAEFLLKLESDLHIYLSKKDDEKCLSLEKTLYLVYRKFLSLRKKSPRNFYKAIACIQACN